MYDFYGIYTSCRDAAWRCQIDFETRSLPIKVLPLARSAGIAVIKNSAVNELQKNESGATIRYRGNWFIIYDDTLPNNEARMVIAHELGHILLGHEYKFEKHRFGSATRKLRCEKEADMFAIRLLAPACVLHELGVLNADELSNLCEIPLECATSRAARLRELEVRSQFYKSPLEKKVYDLFSDYITEYRQATQPINE